MTAKVVLVDYGVGNLLSVRRALEVVGAEVEVTGDVQAIRAADRIVVPGVGAFGNCVSRLKQFNLTEELLEFSTRERPFLGICVGMQMLLDGSDEFGGHDGLGLIPGRVSEVPATGLDNQPHKVPHIGWNELCRSGDSDWSASILKDVAEGDAVYFVHSFAAQPVDPAHAVAHVDYNGRSITAVVQRGLTMGTQFHPERSGDIGLRIMSRFIAL